MARLQGNFFLSSQRQLRGKMSLSSFPPSPQIISVRPLTWWVEIHVMVKPIRKENIFLRWVYSHIIYWYSSTQHRHWNKMFSVLYFNTYPWMQDCNSPMLQSLHENPQPSSRHRIINSICWIYMTWLKKCSTSSHLTGSLWPTSCLIDGTLLSSVKEWELMRMESRASLQIYFFI